MNEEKKEKKISIDKDFLDLIVKANTDLKAQVELALKRISDLETKGKEAIVSVPLIQDPKSQSVFWSAEIFISNPKSLTEIADLQASTTQFREQLEVLMRKYKVGSVSASLLAKQ